MVNSKRFKSRGLCPFMQEMTYSEALQKKNILLATYGDLWRLILRK